MARSPGWVSLLGGAVITLGVAACSSSSTPGSGGVMPIRTNHTSFGTVLSDASGRSLYLFESDTATTSTCYNACVGLWPAVTTSGSLSARTPAPDGTSRHHAP